MPAIVALRRGDAAKVAAQHRGCRNVPLNVRRILPVDRLLIAAEEEKFVLPDRTANRSAKLISLERAMAFLSGGRIDQREVVRRIQQVVSDELEKISMKLVRAGFRDGEAGLLVSKLNAYYVFLKLAKLWELQHRA